MQGWLDRGDTIAVCRNHDLSSRAVGCLQFFPLDVEEVQKAEIGKSKGVGPCGGYQYLLEALIPPGSVLEEHVTFEDPPPEPVWDGTCDSCDEEMEEDEPRADGRHLCDSCEQDPEVEFAGQFMEPEWYEGDYYEVQADHGSTYIVPTDVCAAKVHGDLQDYVEAKIDEPEKPVEVQHGWLYRFSAPGYMDCTDWSVAESEEAAKAALLEEA